MTESKKTPGPGGDGARMDVEHVFQFNCGTYVPCFTECCQDITIVLSPYDVLRLKNALNLHSEEFIDRHTVVLRREKLLIPMVVLKMNEDDKQCPFVTEQGCTVYPDRPWPCRMYPLNMNDDGTFSLITDSSRCKGLEQDEKNRISNWLIEQGVPMYDEMNHLFAQVTTPLKAQDLDIDNPKIYQMTFMALYNIDKFRDFVFKSTFLDRFELDDLTIEKLKRNDVDLLKFAFDWIKFGIFGQKTLRVKESAMPKGDQVP
ncbi:MAG TPA: YkgJ family cysteine cluster protein [Deltaproteobacteria bacterium]|nr:YkgJ family cysteine cluster protein [Deltaproteobacteria bacterium]